MKTINLNIEQLENENKEKLNKQKQNPKGLIQKVKCDKQYVIFSILSSAQMEIIYKRLKNTIYSGGSRGQA